MFYFGTWRWILNSRHYVWELLPDFLIQHRDAHHDRGFYCGVCRRKGKRYQRQDMCLYCISFLKPLEGNICLLTPTLTHRHTIGLPLPHELRKWILSVRIRGFPRGEVHGGIESSERNADVGSCNAGQGYPSLPEELLFVCVRVHALSHVYAWMHACNITASV